MKLSARIDSDCKNLDSYFQKLFTLLQEAIEDENFAPIELYDLNSTEAQAKYFSFSRFIKPDMVINIYSLVEFWMKEICKIQKTTRKLNHSFEIIKREKKSDLEIYNEFLTEYAELSISEVQVSYFRLNELRIVRNKLIHSGSHLLPNEINQLASISGIRVTNSILIIEDSFIEDTLKHAKKYLITAANCIPNLV